MIDPSSIDPKARRLMLAGRWSDALPLAERAIAGSAMCTPGHSFLASILLKLGRLAEAEAVVDGALALAAGSAEACDGLAYVSTELGRHERANALYRRAVELAPRRPRGWYNLACSERSFGRLDAAEAACERAIGLDGGQYPSFLLRSELKVQTPAGNHIADLEARLADPRLAIDGRIFLGYALAKELDDVQRFDEAFQHFATAAKARRSQIRYDVAADEQRLQRIAQVFSAEWAREHGLDRPSAQPGHAARPADSPYIFIVGLPRSGTTLVERILTGLAAVKSNGETDNFARALTAATTSNEGDMFERAAAAEPDAVAAHYSRLAGAVAAGAPAPGAMAPGAKVVEKLPTNYLYVGAIRRALPDARIVCVRRSPLDSCFAIFRALFGNAYPFSYDFAELARYYAAYDALMNHWRHIFGESVHEVVYEELVRDPARVAMSLAQHCGLEWRPEALEIEGNRSVSLTASAAQVRRPIYGSSSGRWRHYRLHLTPLISALRHHGVSLPDDATS